ncbi:cytochrome P450 [Xylariaceae sp. FL0804]|nr:cytochrome P450 [Xylariaceae sp. FL0804]
MHPGLLLGLAAGVLAIIHLSQCVYRYIASPLKAVPGPLVARFTDLWYFWRVRRGGFQQDNRDLHEKYGPVVRYGPNRYSISHPDALRDIYGIGTHFPKSSWYSSYANPGTWTYFSDRDMERSKAHRRLVQGIYSMTALIDYEPYVEDCSQLLLQRLREVARGGELANIGHWMQCYAFDVIGMITYSRRLGFLDRGEDVGSIISEIDADSSYATQTGIYPGLHPYLYRLRNYLSRGKEVGRAYVFKFTSDLIAEHEEKTKSGSSPPPLEEEVADGQAASSGSGRPTDFLTKVLAKQASAPDTFTAYHVLATCGANMMAGSDTTAITLSAVLYHLLRRPDALQALRDEVDQHREPVAFATAQQQMPYLQACIREALRLHPATGLPLERVVPAGGAVVADTFFPEGTVVGVNSWVEHYNKDIWGSDAHEFKPERWLTKDADKLSEMNRHWMPFGLGSRNCVGRHISILEISKLVPRLVRNFDFELSPELSRPEATWTVSNSFLVKPLNFIAKVKTRSFEV